MIRLFSETASQYPVPQKLIQQDNVSLDGFIGVKRKRQNTQKFFLSGNADSVSAQEKRDIKPTYLLLYKSIGQTACSSH